MKFPVVLFWLISAARAAPQMFLIVPEDFVESRRDLSSVRSASTRVLPFPNDSSFDRSFTGGPPMKMEEIKTHIQRVMKELEQNKLARSLLQRMMSRSSNELTNNTDLIDSNSHEVKEVENFNESANLTSENDPEEAENTTRGAELISTSTFSTTFEEASSLPQESQQDDIAASPKEAAAPSFDDILKAMFISRNIPEVPEGTNEILDQGKTISEVAVDDTENTTSDSQNTTLTKNSTPQDDSMLLQFKTVEETTPFSETVEEVTTETSFEEALLEDGLSFFMFKGDEEAVLEATETPIELEEIITTDTPHFEASSSKKKKEDNLRNNVVNIGKSLFQTRVSTNNAHQSEESNKALDVNDESFNQLNVESATERFTEPLFTTEAPADFEAFETTTPVTEQETLIFPQRNFGNQDQPFGIPLIPYIVREASEADDSQNAIIESGVSLSDLGSTSGATENDGLNEILIGSVLSDFQTQQRVSNSQDEKLNTEMPDNLSVIDDAQRDDFTPETTTLVVVEDEFIPTESPFLEDIVDESLEPRLLSVSETEEETLTTNFPQEVTLAPAILFKGNDATSIENSLSAVAPIEFNEPIFSEPTQKASTDAEETPNNKSVTNEDFKSLNLSVLPVEPPQITRENDLETSVGTTEIDAIDAGNMHVQENRDLLNDSTNDATVPSIHQEPKNETTQVEEDLVNHQGASFIKIKATNGAFNIKPTTISSIKLEATNANEPLTQIQESNSQASPSNGHSEVEESSPPPIQNKTLDLPVDNTILPPSLDINGESPVPNVNVKIVKANAKKESENVSPNRGKSLNIETVQRMTPQSANLLAQHFGFHTPASVSLVKSNMYLHNGVMVDPKSLVAPQFRDFIYYNEAPEVVAAKIAFFNSQDGIANNK